MKYQSKYNFFDVQQIRTYPISVRTNKVGHEDLINPHNILKQNYTAPDDISQKIQLLAEAIIDAKKNQKPVICFTGGHLIKNGLGLVLADLVNREMVTLIAGNGATSIHDFELALLTAR